MQDFMSKEEIRIFTSLGPMGPASECPFRPYDLRVFRNAIRSIGGSPGTATDKRIVNTFRPKALAPGGGDVAFNF